jgi:hypothetical protein
MKKPFVVALLVIAFQSYGQNNRFMFGASTSLDWNSYVFLKEPDGLDVKGTLNYTVGITARKYFSQRFSIAGAIHYASRNYKEYLEDDYYEYIEPGDPIVGNGGGVTYTYKHGFVDIPVSFAYGVVVTDKLELLPSIGVVNSILIHNRNEREAPVQYANYEVSQKPRYNNHLLAAKLGFGLLLKQERFGILIEPEARIYATRVSPYGVDKNPFQLGLGASFLWWK